MGFKISLRSKMRLRKVHPDIALVVRRCAADWPDNGSRFVVSEGIRSLKRQRKLVAAAKP